MSDESFKTYLASLNIPANDKRYALSFFKKADYFESLREIANKDTNKTISMGYGNFNSKISFVIEDSDIFDIIKPSLMECMDVFDISFWHIYMTFIDKVNINYPEKYNLLIHELHAVAPDVLYLFVRNQESYNKILDEYKAKSISLPCKVFHIIVPENGIDDKLLQKQFFGMFKYLINYKEIE